MFCVLYSQYVIQLLTYSLVIFYKPLFIEVGNMKLVLMHKNILREITGTDQESHCLLTQHFATIRLLFTYCC